MRPFIIVFVLSVLTQAAEPLRCPETPSHLAMEKGEYASRPGVVFALQNFSANMVPRGKKMPLCLAKITDIEYGHVIASNASLTKLFAQKMKTSNQQSITSISVHTKGEHVVIRGTV